MRVRWLLILASIAVEVALVETAVAQSFTDSGFETPSIATYQLTPNGYGWNFAGRSYIQHNGSAWGAASAPEGVQTAALQGIVGPPTATASMNQSILFNSAGYYYISFKAALRTGYLTQPIKFSLDGAQVGSTLSQMGPAFLGYTTPLFYASAGSSHTLDFASTNTADDRTAFLDAFAINAYSVQASKNLDFESPDLSSVGWAFSPSGASWIFSGRGGIQHAGSAWNSATPPSGSQTAVLQGYSGDSANPGTMEQLFALGAGTSMIAFNAAQRSTSVSQSVLISYLAQGSTGPWTDIGTITPTSTAFAIYSVPVTVSSAGNYRIRFKATDTSADKSVFVDQVAISPTIPAGGTNFAWWKVDVTYNGSGVPTSCIREPYGVIPNYNQPGVRTAAQAQLAAMYAAGQRRLVIPVFVGIGLDTGTVMNVASGDLSAQNKANLSQFIADIKSAGFVELLIKMNAVGDISPINWTQFSESNYQTFKGVVFSVRNLMATTGIAYRMDLLGEGSPSSVNGQPTNPYWSTFVQRLWSDYVASYGKNETVGFSIPVGFDIASRISHFAYIYQGNYPYLFSFHIYDDVANEFTQVHNLLNQNGFTGWGIVIGETFFNDATDAAAFSTTIAQLGRPVFYLMQWPLSRLSAYNSPDSDCAHHVSESNLTPFSYYHAYGF
jgi:hypothetical protein